MSRQNALTVLGFLAFLSASCVKQVAVTAGSVTPGPATGTISSTGAVTVRIDPANGGVVATTGITSRNPLFSRAELVVPPGALSVAVDVSVFEATPVVNSSTAALLEITGAVAIGPSVALSASNEGALVAPLTLSLPYWDPAQLAPGYDLAVIGMYRTGNKFVAETFVGDELAFDQTGVVKVRISRFGAYQVARVSGTVSKKSADSNVGFMPQSEAEESGAAAYSAFLVATTEELPVCDATRVSHLFYVLSSRSFRVCNGSTWTVVDLSPPSPPVANENLFAGPATTSTLTVSGRQVSRLTTQFYSAPGGALVRTCYRDSLTSAITNGNKGEIQNDGEAGCPKGGSWFFWCDSGYVLQGTSCVAASSAPVCSQANPSACTTLTQCKGVSQYWDGNTCRESCPAGKQDFSRGCEVPTPCTANQRNVDNQCVSISWQEKTGDLCGTYNLPVKVKSGTHTVLCDVTFAKELFIEPGTTIEFEGNYGFVANRTTYAVGTSAQPITLRKSGSNPDGYWGQLQIGNIFRAFISYPSEATYNSGYSIIGNDFVGNYLGGTNLSYVSISDSTCANNSRFEGFANQTSIVCAGNSSDLTLGAGYIKNSSFSSVQISCNPFWGEMVFEASSWTGDSFSMYNSNFTESYVLRSNLTGSGVVNVLGGVVAFSHISTSWLNLAPSSYALGNFVEGVAPPADSGYRVTDNSATAVSSRTAVFAMAVNLGTTGASITGTVNHPFNAYAWVFDKDGWVTDPVVNWSSSYGPQGAPVSGPSGTGAVVSLTPTVPEVHNVRIDSIVGRTDLMGKRSVIATINP